MPEQKCITDINIHTFVHLYYLPFTLLGWGCAPGYPCVYMYVCVVYMCYVSVLLLFPLAFPVGRVLQLGVTS